MFWSFNILYSYSYGPSHQVCKPSYFVPVPSQDKLGGCQEGHPAWKWWGWPRWGHQSVWMWWQTNAIIFKIRWQPLCK